MTISSLTFRVALQPIINADTRTPYGYEALTRGPGGEGAATVFEQVPTNALNAFDEATQVAAVREFARVNLAGYLSINCLATTVLAMAVGEEPAFVSAARSCGLPLERIVVELSESESISDWNALTARLTAWRQLGLRIAFDDFCAGFSGLTFVQEFRPDLLKLDRALITDIDKDSSKQAIARAVLQLCRRTGSTCVAEGIETAAEAAVLCELGLSLHQGYFWQRPQVDLVQGLEFAFSQ